MCFGKGHWVLIPFLIWVVNFEWESGILIQLLICVVNYCQNLYLHPMVIKAKRCVSISDPHQNILELDTLGDLCCFKPLASKLLNPMIGEYCVIGRHIALHMSGSEDTDPCCFTDLWLNARVLRFAFCQHPTADVLARWKRF